MLKNERNLKSNRTDYDLVFPSGNRVTRRKVLRTFKRQEDATWRSLEELPKHWADAEPGEVWDLKMDGEWDLYVKLESGHWKSLDHKWYIIQGDGDEAITAGNPTEVEVDVLEY